uniref:RTR1-type domain-containing protein n=1 Tax=Corethron hystrix TaxID=216773 RepID=A0A7S1B6I8_9STRA|mmetsp:Transcript_14563/g.32079  ORF Transcript_14563/g.32079 Transcript_14563/m.32079 type:complete len:618 (+) Transcript_14563:3-1856(+)
MQAASLPPRRNDTMANYVESSLHPASVDSTTTASSGTVSRVDYLLRTYVHFEEGGGQCHSLGVVATAADRLALLRSITSDIIVRDGLSAAEYAGVVTERSDPSTNRCGYPLCSILHSSDREWGLRKGRIRRPRHSTLRGKLDMAEEEDNGGGSGAGAYCSDSCRIHSAEIYQMLEKRGPKRVGKDAVAAKSHDTVVKPIQNARMQEKVETTKYIRPKRRTKPGRVAQIGSTCEKKKEKEEGKTSCPQSNGNLDDLVRETLSRLEILDRVQKKDGMSTAKLKVKKCDEKKNKTDKSNSMPKKVSFNPNIDNGTPRPRVMGEEKKTSSKSIVKDVVAERPRRRKRNKNMTANKNISLDNSSNNVIETHLSFSVMTASEYEQDKHLLLQNKENDGSVDTSICNSECKDARSHDNVDTCDDDDADSFSSFLYGISSSEDEDDVHSPPSVRPFTKIWTALSGWVTPESAKVLGIHCDDYAIVDSETKSSVEEEEVTNDVAASRMAAMASMIQSHLAQSCDDLGIHSAHSQRKVQVKVGELIRTFDCGGEAPREFDGMAWRGLTLVLVGAITHAMQGGSCEGNGMEERRASERVLEVISAMGISKEEYEYLTQSMFISLSKGS